MHTPAKVGDFSQLPDSINERQKGQHITKNL